MLVNKSRFNTCSTTINLAGAGELAEDSARRQTVVDASKLLEQLLLQDIERKGGDGDVRLKGGVSKDRMVDGA